MRKAFRNIEHILEALIQDDSGSLPKRSTVRTEVCSCIKHLSSGKTDQLSLSMILLEVNASQHAFGRRTLIVLSERSGDASLFKQILLVCFHEIDALVAMQIRVDDNDSGNLCYFKPELFVQSSSFLALYMVS